MTVPAWQPFVDDVLRGIVRRLRRPGKPLHVLWPKHERPPFHAEPFRCGVVTSLPIGLSTLSYGMRWDAFEDPTSGQVGNVAMDGTTPPPQPWPRGYIGVLTHAECYVGLVVPQPEGPVWADPTRQFRWTLLHNDVAIPGFLNTIPTTSLHSFWPGTFSLQSFQINPQTVTPSRPRHALEYRILRPEDRLGIRFDNLAASAGGGGGPIVVSGFPTAGVEPNLGGGGGGGGNPVIVVGQHQPLQTNQGGGHLGADTNPTWSIVLLVGGWRCRLRD